VLYKLTFSYLLELLLEVLRPPTQLNPENVSVCVHVPTYQRHVISSQIDLVNQTLRLIRRQTVFSLLSAV